jgi:hypothetical protein
VGWLIVILTLLFGAWNVVYFIVDAAVFLLVIGLMVAVLVVGQGAASERRYVAFRVVQ